MGYRWQENTQADLAYDLFIFKPKIACVVRVRQTRYRINPDTIYEDLIPDDLREVRSLPFPPWIIREISAPYAARAGLAPSPDLPDHGRRDRLVGAGRLHKPVLPVSSTPPRAGPLYR